MGANIAHYFQLGLTEAGRVVPVTFATFGLGTANLPIFVAHPAVIAFLQGVTLLVAVLLSIILTQKIARQSFWTLLPQHIATGAIAAGLWQIIVGW